jgi:glycopeptide antibiotics resistance protein
MMHSIIDLAMIGTLGLTLYMVYDVVKHRTQRLLKRMVFYSFIFYVVYVLQLTTGGIMIPQNEELGHLIIQWIPFRFVADWVSLYSSHGMDWFFWNAVKLTIFNLILLFPFGVYLSVLFNLGTAKQAAAVLFLVTLFIETGQLVLSYLGLIFPRSFDVDDLILNTLGGVIGFKISELLFKNISLLNRIKRRMNDSANH